MRNRPRGSRRGRRDLAFLAVTTFVLLGWAVAGPAAGAAIGFAGGLALFAWSLPGAAPDGVLIGFGVPLVSMIGWQHPGHRLWAAVSSTVLAAVVLLRVRARQRGYVTLGAFWLSVPVAVCAAVA